MATFTTAVTVPNANGLGLDTFAYDVNNLANYLSVTRSTTQLRYFDNANNEQIFTGVGFTYDVNGNFTSGTITGYLFREGGVVSLNAAGLSVAAAPVGTAIGSGNTFQFRSLMSAGNDTITGSALQDEIYFGDNSGSDSINGLGGGDYIDGGFGGDTINGGLDNDFIVGGEGNDILDGGVGGDDFDTLDYSEDYIYSGGTAGVSVNLSGTTQGSLLTGRAIDAFGNTDTISNFEEVWGTGFADTVYAAALVNEQFHFSGFAGNDTFVGSTAQDRIAYDQDERFASIANASLGLALVARGITVNFAGDTVAGNGASGSVSDSFGNTDTVSGVEVIRATFFVDTFNGGVDGEEFMGLKGADVINGGGGFDIAAYYNDKWDNGPQAGGLAGITANFSSDTLANGISVGTVVDGFGTIDQLTNIEAIDGTEFNDTMTGGADRVEFWSGRGDDTLTGGSADDELDGGDGTDTIHGNGGNDNIRGDDGGNINQGNDQLFGEAGDDRFKGGAGNDLIDGGADWDRVEYNLETTFEGDDATHGVIVNLSGAALVNVSVAGIAITSVAAGSAIDSRNYIDTLVAIEDIWGTGYDDIIVADVGENSLDGYSGADTLKGGLEADFLVGGAGNDILDGGTGGDDFDTLGYIDEYIWESGTQGITVNLSGVAQGALLTGRAIDAFGNADTVTNFEDVRGTGFADTVYAAVLVDNPFSFSGFAGNDTFVGTSGRDRIDYRRDEKNAVDANAQRGLSLVAHGITVNFAGDTVAGNGASGTVSDSFSNIDTVSGVDIVRGTFFVDSFNGGIDGEEFRGLKGADIINGGGGFDVAAYYNDLDGNGLQAGGLAGITANFAGDTLANGISVGSVVDGFGTIDQLTNIEAIEGTEFADTMTGGADRVEFRGNGGTDTLNGGSANDELQGGNGTDTIHGNADNDNIRGDEGGNVDQGNDQLFGEAGDDTFKGGAGNDLINGGADRDRVEYDLETTFTGDDAVHGVIVNMTVAALVNVSVAGIANTTVAAGTAVDTRNYVDTLVAIEDIQGTGYADIIFADVGNNTLEGNGGTDSLSGGSGTDTLLGGDGNDTFFYAGGNTGLDQVNGGNDTDTLDFSGLANLAWVDLAYAGTEAWTKIGATWFGLANTVSIENVVGSAVADQLWGDAFANTLSGGAGADRIEGRAGADILNGGLDADTFVYSGSNNGVDQVDGGDGLDTLDFTSQATFAWVDLAYTGVSGIEAWTQVGATWTQVVNVTAVENVTGTAFADQLWGNGLGNTLSGGNGNDRLEGRGGADVLNGGNDNDTFIYAGANNGVDQVDGGLGTDTLDFAGQSTFAWVDLAYTGASGIEAWTQVGTTWTTVANVTAVENITGTAFADQLWGNTQANAFTGGLGNDRLDGRTGADSATGGAGSDTFLFAAGASGQTATTLDIITDFTKGAVGTGDKIDYTALLSIGGSTAAATATEASISAATGVASFAAGSGITLADALLDIATRMTTGTDANGEFALFRVNGAGDFNRV
jgi:Ca2+-binding RTX toxin-like protein